MGIVLAGGEINYYREGDAVKVPAHGKLWWVHAGQYVLNFAPVESAPEAGVLLLLEVLVNKDKDKVQSGLIDWLLDCRHPTLATYDVIAELRGHSLLHLPPCVQREELREIAKSLSSKLQNMGLYCTHLERTDIYPAFNCAAQPENLPAESVKAQTTQAVIGNDVEDHFGRRLFIELPLLANRLRSFPMPKDNVALTAHLSLLRRLERMASTTGRLPELGELFGHSPIPSGVEYRLHMEARRAVQKLDEAWCLIGDDAEEFMQPVQQRRFARKLAGIEESIARRRTPWWQAE
jgi:hypothetical protein